LDFGGKPITVRSIDPQEPSVVENTVIDCQNSGRGFYFHSGEDSNSVVDGLVITNGYASAGGGIRCYNSSPMIRNCILTRNSANTYKGGAISCENSKPTITHCTITGNFSYYAGIKCHNCSATISNCTIVDNFGYGILSYNGGNNIVTNCIVWNNYRKEIDKRNSTVSYSDVKGGCSGVGNINADPCFVAPQSGNYHLSPYSLCINAGDPNHVSIAGEADIDGEARVINGRIDIGVDEFNYEGPLLRISNEELNFSTYRGQNNPEPQILAIYNSGSGTLIWQIFEECSWLEVTPSNGESFGDTNEVVFSIDVSGLNTGSYSCEVIISADETINSPQTLVVNLQVLGPIMRLSEMDFEFSSNEGGVNPGGQILYISNVGEGILDWTISYECDWLELNPLSGSSTDDVEVILSVNTSGLREGVYNCEVAISEDEPWNNLLTVPVTLIVNAKLRVPSEYQTIQEAVNAALNGDTIFIADGVYTGEGNRDVDFLGKAITVRSENGPQNCIIDCENSGRGFYFHSGEDPNSILAGFTIKNGYAHNGAGIYCNGSSPLIRNCNFIEGSAQEWGGGIYCYKSSPLISNCTFTGNSAFEGGAITTYSYWNYLCSPHIENCHIFGNTASGSGGGINSDCLSTPVISNCLINRNNAGMYGGGGISIFQSNPTINGCTIVDNSTEGSGCGILQWYEFENGSKLKNCIIWGNKFSSAPQAISGPSGPQITVGSEMSISYCDIEGMWIETLPAAIINWGSGNIDADPFFVAPVEGDYHLLEYSVCIDNGDPCYIPGHGETDIDGEPRVMGQHVDIGADEFTAAQIPLIEILPTACEFDANEGGTNPEPRVLSIRNIRAGTLAWQIIEECPWLEAIPSNGESTGEVDRVMLSVDTVGLGEGLYYCEVIVSDTQASNSPQVVQVNLVVRGPEIEVSTERLKFVADEGGANPQDQTFTIRNTGELNIDWEIICDCDWLEVDPCVGSSAGEPDDVAVSVDIRGLTAGQYNCTLTISSVQVSNEPNSVEVIVYVVDDIRRVPQEYPTIQAAINAASSGDTVIVSPGTYLENLSYKGKTISLQSASGPDLTTIRGNGGTVVRMGGGAKIIGFTITGGYADFGAGIKVYGSKSVIRGNIFEGNIQKAGGYGAAIGGSNTSPIIVNNIFRGNKSDNQWLSGVISFVNDSSPLIANNIFENNSSNAIVLTLPGGNRPRVTNNTIVGNRIGIRVDTRVNQNKQVFRNNILIGNQNGLRIEHGWHSYYPTWEYNLVFANNKDYVGIPDQTEISGNISVDPFFDNPSASYYHLSSGSPGINAGDPNYPDDQNETDIDGQPRIIGGRVDMGSDEFHGNNVAPIVDAGEDQTVCAWTDSIAEVVLDGTASHDDDGHRLSYIWAWTIDGNNFTAVGPCPTVELPLGKHRIELIVNDRIEDSEKDEVVITITPSVETLMHFTPQRLNPRSHGKWLKAHLILPEAFGVDDVDADTPATIEPLGINSQYINVLVNEGGLVEIEVAFARADFCSNGPFDGTVIVEGLLTSGQCFYGTDAIRIIPKNLKDFAVFASHWRQTDCGPPDWCSGADLDRSSMVDFADLAMFGSCCFEVVEE
jgi:hypothetical protein